MAQDSIPRSDIVTQETKPPPAPDAAVDGVAKHIVDVLIEERAAGLMTNKLAWALTRALLNPVMRYRSAIRWVDSIHGLDAAGVADFASKELTLRLDVSGLEKIPRSGPLIIAANHPTGIPDGLAVYDALKSARPDMIFFANRDAIRVAPSLADLVIPVEWVETKRTRADSRETLRAAVQAFKDGRCIVMFPSGRLAKRVGFHLRERPWQTTPINFARRFSAPIAPLHISGQNSWAYYFFDLFSQELKNMTLFRELINKRNDRYKLRFGTPIPSDIFSKSMDAEIEYLRRYVDDDMRAAEFPAFTDALKINRTSGA